MLRARPAGVEGKSWVQACGLPVDIPWESEGNRMAKKQKPPGANRAACRGSGTQAVSPYTVTLMSTSTSVCRDTLTPLSPTTLIGPLGMRICDLTTL